MRNLRSFLFLYRSTFFHFSETSFQASSLILFPHWFIWTTILLHSFRWKKVQIEEDFISVIGCLWLDSRFSHQLLWKNEVLSYCSNHSSSWRHCHILSRNRGANFDHNQLHNNNCVHNYNIYCHFLCTRSHWVVWASQISWDFYLLIGLVLKLDPWSRIPYLCIPRVVPLRSRSQLLQLIQIKPRLWNPIRPEKLRRIFGTQLQIGM